MLRIFPLAEYNSACAFSMLSQVTVERALVVSSRCKWVEKLFAELNKPAEIENSVWISEIGPRWREILEKGKNEWRQVFRTPADAEELDRYAQAALAELERLHEKWGRFSTKNATIPMPGLEYDRHFSANDSDFLFLKSDPKFSKEFEKWTGNDQEREDLLFQPVENVLRATGHLRDFGISVRF